MLSREDLYELVWAEPMMKAAEEFDVSGSCLARICARGHHSRKVGAGQRLREFRDERVRMAQYWSDYIDQLREGETVAPIRWAVNE